MTELVSFEYFRSFWISSCLEGEREGERERENTIQTFLQVTFHDHELRTRIMKRKISCSIAPVITEHAHSKLAYIRNNMLHAIADGGEGLLHVCAARHKTGWMSQSSGHSDKEKPLSCLQRTPWHPSSIQHRWLTDD
jgi:hypothetical protein